jgi:HlyD family secretion protein
MSDLNNIELRSEAMQDILTRPPHLLVRSGISVICAVILLLLVGSFFFKYPDKVNGEIIITTENPPVWLIAQTNGKIQELNCEDKSHVNPGQVLAVIENPAVTADIHQVKEQVHVLFDYLPFTHLPVPDSAFRIPPGFLTRTYELGTVQNSYSVFLRTLTNYENFLSYNTTTKEKEALQLQIREHQRYSQTLQRQLALKQEELNLANSAVERERQLYGKGVISQADMDAAENSYLNIRQSYQQLQTAIASDRIELSNLDKNVSTLDTQYQKEKYSLLSELQTAAGELASAIENWEQLYLLVSPVEGTVTLNTFWTQNQFVGAGEKVLAVVSGTPGQIIGRIQTAAQGSGKVHSGQRVTIKVQGYPYMEYGTLQGKVKNISLLSNEKRYLVEVALPQGLRTVTGKTLNFTGELTGEAEIITDDRNLFSRILSPLEYLLKNQLGDES